jgi:hypothetical protein
MLTVNVALPFESVTACQLLITLALVLALASWFNVTLYPDKLTPLTFALSFAVAVAVPPDELKEVLLNDNDKEYDTCVLLTEIVTTLLYIVGIFLPP